MPSSATSKILPLTAAAFVVVQDVPRPLTKPRWVSQAVNPRETPSGPVAKREPVQPSDVTRTGADQPPAAPAAGDSAASSATPATVRRTY